MSRARLASVALVLLAAAPASALPTADEVRANVRRAVGFEAFRTLERGLDLEGKAEFFGLPGTFKMRLLPDGRYARVIEAGGTHAVGFDGKTRWGRNFADPVIDLHFEEADRDRFLFGVLCHRWLAADGGFTAAVDEKSSRPYKLDLVLTHPEAGVAARLSVDPATWLPDTLHVPGEHRGRLFDFADYRTIAGVTLPVRVGQNRYDGGQWVTAERAGPALPGPDPCARPAVRPRVTFDPGVPARLEARKGPGGMVLVRGAVDGKPTPWLVLDTGNGAQTMLVAGVADRFGLPAAGGGPVFGVGGSARSRFRTAGRFTLGPAAIPDPVFADGPDAIGRVLSESAGAEVGGFVGHDVLFRVVVEMDPGAGTAAVHDPAAYQLPAGGTWEPVRFNGRNPCVTAAFEGAHAAGWYSLDTGFEAALVFHLPAVARGKLLAGRETEPHALVGVGGEEAVRLGPGGVFRVFGRSARTPATLYAVDPAGGHTCPYTLGTFGPSALGPGVLVLDYPNSRIGFVPKP